MAGADDAGRGRRYRIKSAPLMPRGNWGEEAAFSPGIGGGLIAGNLRRRRGVKSVPVSTFFGTAATTARSRFLRSGKRDSL